MDSRAPPRTRTVPPPRYVMCTSFRAYIAPHTFCVPCRRRFQDSKGTPTDSSGPPLHCGVYFAPCVLCSIHRSLWTQEVPPRTIEVPPPRMRCVLSSVCTLLHIHVSVTVVSGHPCPGFSNTVFCV